MSTRLTSGSSEPPADTTAEEEAPTHKLSIAELDEEHRLYFIRAITRLVSTEIAEVTYAQLIDGLPLSAVAGDRGYSSFHNDHPIYEVHEELCPGIMEKARKFRDDFQLETLRFDAKAAAPGSRAFNIHLIELMAVALHQIAVVIYQRDESIHKNDGVHDWAPPKSDEKYWRLHPNGPLPTLFQHSWYLDYDQYPNGAADMAGYWAEAQIFGGVVLFDRRSPAENPDADQNAVYLHPDRYEAPYRIVQLLPEQRQALLDFLVGESEPTAPLLPIMVDKSNTRRVDPEESIRETGIYRDLWERKDFPPWANDQRLRDVWDRFNFPTGADKSAAARRARHRKWRIEEELYREMDREEEEAAAAQKDVM
ncbi:uncharacterized protein PG998_008651 [Apiospora kogelbergensis]|uniref:uncharacterized protein n=1 Tax=Apiospora kogelbergensis TaxID=1337665 RepID=UPI0031308AA4